MTTQKLPMLSVDDALNQLLQAARRVDGVEVVPTIDAVGRVLAADQSSTIDVPPMDNTQMDGYAVRAGDCASGAALLRVSQRIPAGHIGQPLEPGTVARIFTGAIIPPGADAVVMQERCEVDGAGKTAGENVIVRHVPQQGEWIRRAGEDIRAGAVILQAGTRLRGQELGLAASVGLAELPVVRRLKVAVFFTGDELTMPGQPLKPGAIYNSNRFMLRGLLDALGCETTDYGIVGDTLDATRAALRLAAQEHDLIITSGGVSVGEEDHIKPAVEAEGRLNMWQIAVKPGKPLAFGEIDRVGRTLHAVESRSANAVDVSKQTGDSAASDRSTEGATMSRESGKHDAAANEQDAGRGAASKPVDVSGQSRRAFFLGLPGNPVSSFVTFLLFVRPFILTLQGANIVAPAAYPMRADFNWPKPDRRQEFLRAKRNAQGGLDLFPNQGSGVLTSTVWGDGLVDNPAGKPIAAGEVVRFIPFSSLIG